MKGKRWNLSALTIACWGLSVMVFAIFIAGMVVFAEKITGIRSFFFNSLFSVAIWAELLPVGILALIAWLFKRKEIRPPLLVYILIALIVIAVAGGTLFVLIYVLIYSLIVKVHVNDITQMLMNFGWAVSISQLLWFAAYSLWYMKQRIQMES